MPKAQKLFAKLRWIEMAWQMNFEPAVVLTSNCQIAVADMLLVMDLVSGWQLGSKNFNLIFINCVPSGYDLTVRHGIDGPIEIDGLPIRKCDFPWLCQ